MKKAEFAVIIIAGIAFAGLVLYRTYFKDKKSVFWRDCGADIQAICTNPPGDGSKAVRTVRCLIENHKRISPSCQQLISLTYPKLLRGMTARRSKVQKKAPAAKLPPQYIYSKANHKTCQKKLWPKPCAVQNVENGNMTLCLSQNKNLRVMVPECLGVTMEIALWAPRPCATTIKNICAMPTSYDRLNCAAANPEKFPSSCKRWMGSVSRITKEYRRRNP